MSNRDGISTDIQRNSHSGSSLSTRTSQIFEQSIWPTCKKILCKVIITSMKNANKKIKALKIFSCFSHCLVIFIISFYNTFL